MNALAKALARDTRTYRVDVPWSSLGLLEPLRGSLCVVLAQPGMGKSALALNWALGINSPSLLVSLDTDLTTQAIRAAAISSGTPMQTVKKDPKAWSLYLNRMASRVRAYDIGVQPKEILGMVNAETEYWGVPPELTIVDNISNLVREGDYQEYRKLFVDLHRIARAGDTFVLALHHVNRGPKPGSPLKLTDGQYSGEQEAEMVLGLWNKDEDYLNVSVLKNRSGRADPTGKLYSTLRFDRQTMRIRDLTQSEEAVAVLKGGIL